jgi:hypothetical protein
VEAHRVREEISGNPHDGLGNLLSLLKEFGRRATFFVDVCEIKTWGEDFLRQTCDRIAADGHPVELHVHPHHASGDSKRWLLTEYSSVEQTFLLEQSLSDFQRLTGHRPSVFRAGGFGIGDHAIDWLVRQGIHRDSSYVYRHPASVIRPAAISEPTPYRGLTEIPLTPIVTWGSAKSPRRVSAVDFNWLPADVIERAMEDARRMRMARIILLMHSSSLFLRTGSRSFKYSARLERKLVRLLKFANQQGFKDEVLSDVRQAAEGVPLGEPLVVKGPIRQVRVLLYQAHTGKGFRTKFLLVWLTAVSTLVFFAAVLLYLVWLASIVGGIAP